MDASEVFDQWRPNGDRISYKDAAWSGASLGIVLHATLHFFSIAIPSLDRFLFLFGPPERFASAIAHANPLATWLSLMILLAMWGCLAGVVLLALVHGLTDLVRSALRSRTAIRP